MKPDLSGTTERGGGEGQKHGRDCRRREAPGLSRRREAQSAGKKAVGAGVPNGVVRCREKKARGRDSESRERREKGLGLRRLRRGCRFLTAAHRFFFACAGKRAWRASSWE